MKLLVDIKTLIKELDFIASFEELLFQCYFFINSLLFS